MTWCGTLMVGVVLALEKGEPGMSSMRIDKFLGGGKPQKRQRTRERRVVDVGPEYYKWILELSRAQGVPISEAAKAIVELGIVEVEKRRKSSV